MQPLTKEVLWKFYKRNNVTYRKASYSYRGEVNGGLRLERERQLFASQIMPLIDAGYPHIFADESAINGFMQPSKVFSQKGTDMRLPLPSQRHSGLTIFGAVGQCLTRPIFQVSPTTNIDEFVSFASILARTVDPTLNVRPLLILDK